MNYYDNISDNVRKNFVIYIYVLLSTIKSIPANQIDEIIDWCNNQNDIINTYRVDNNKVNIKNSEYLLKSQMFVDYFRFLKLQDKLYNTKSVLKLPIIENYNDISDLYKNELFRVYMTESIIYAYNADEYERILMNKSLNKKEIKYLEKLNPCFKQEFELYNKKIDLDYIKNSIEKLRDEYQERPDIAYRIASDFLFDLYRVNKEETLKVFYELFNQDLGIISSKKETEDSIKIENIILNKENLALMLKDYYDYENKQFGLNNGDSYGF